MTSLTRCDAIGGDYWVADDLDHWSAGPPAEPQFKGPLPGSGPQRNPIRIEIDVASAAQVRAFGAWRLTWTQTLLGAIDAGATADLVFANAALKLRFDMDQIADIVFVFDYSVS